MFRRIENGTIYDVQGLPCCIPPQGFVYNNFTGKLEEREIYKRSENPIEQYWEKPKLPYWHSEVMKQWDEYDKKRKDGDPKFEDARLTEFVNQEWDRRINGFWFYNNGNATYLTGAYYTYLTWWNIDVGLPKFRIPDLEKFYFWEYCSQDPLCMGMMEVTKRRFGKSFVAGFLLVERITRAKMAFGGIQSKTSTDAKKFFSKTVVQPFRRLPKFFRPVYDNSLGDNPKSELRFQKPNVRGKAANLNVDEDELGSAIDHQSSDEMAYDGQKLLFYVGDEIGKTKEVNVHERHEVVRYCLLDDEGNIIGKAFYTTTVEKLEGANDGITEAFVNMWSESDHLNKGEDGKTQSGLYRFFTSAKKTRNFDAYGYPDEDKTEAAILLERKKITNARSLLQRIKKEPLTIEEALSSDDDNCIFNGLEIANREKTLSEKPVYLRKILFYRDENGDVKWKDAPKNSEFYWEVSELLPKEADKKNIRGLTRVPNRTNQFAMACDSYSNSQGGRRYGSKASSFLGIKLDINNQEQTQKAIGHLYGRPKEKSELHEQNLLCAEYVGCVVWYEHVSDDYFTHFKNAGRLAYLGKYPMSVIPPEDRFKAPERHYGFPTYPFSLTRQHDVGVAYFENYCYKIDFLILLKQAKKFDPYDRTKSDCVVAFLMLLIVLTEPEEQAKKFTQPLVSIYTS